MNGLFVTTLNSIDKVRNVDVIRVLDLETRLERMMGMMEIGTLSFPSIEIMNIEIDHVYIMCHHHHVLCMKFIERSYSKKYKILHFEIFTRII